MLRIRLVVFANPFAPGLHKGKIIRIEWFDLHVII